MIKSFGEKTPSFGEEVFVAPDAWVIGDVSIGSHVSIFFHAVLRGDILPISIGSGTNIQEHAMIHTSHGRTPTVVGENCTIGHRAIVHGCSLGDRVLVGMGAIILDETEIGDECIIAAGAVVPEGKKIPPRSLVMGVPGKVVRELGEEDLKYLEDSARGYIEAGKLYSRMKL